MRLAVDTMRRVWAGDVTGQGGPMRRLPARRPQLLFGGMVQAAYTRAATQGEGWVAPLFGAKTLSDGVIAVHRSWADAGRPDVPRIVTGRYFSLGPQADAIADDYIRHYYGNHYFAMARADTLTTPQQVRDELDRLTDAGATDVVLYPSSAQPQQLQLLAEAVWDRR
jgi:alkanesulfonate monooxygenase SsuD/methylene tetrahydromethanopterin reductase-like flavin-dependent oxidoreductase (luciferase family)